MQDHGPHDTEHPLCGPLHKAAPAPMPALPDFASPVVLRQFHDLTAQYNTRLLAIRRNLDKAIHAAVADTAG